MQPTPHPVAANAALLRQGIELLGVLDDATFRAAGRVPGWAGVGAQLRHIVEFYACFLCGLGAGRIDYASRQRRSDLERDRAQAAAAFAEVLDALQSLSPGALTGPLEVRDEETPVWSPSSAGRELSFLLSHTVHHFALVRLMLSDAHLPLDADLGVAPSTLRHWAERG